MNRRFSGSGGKLLGTVRSVAFGVFAGTILCALLMAACAAIIVMAGTLPIKFVSAITLVIAGVSAFFSGLITAKLSEARGLLYGSVAALLLTLFYMFFGSILLDEALSGATFTKMIIMVICGVIGGIVGVTGKRKMKTAKKRRSAIRKVSI